MESNGASSSAGMAWGTHSELAIAAVAMLVVAFSLVLALFLRARSRLAHALARITILEEKRGDEANESDEMKEEEDGSGMEMEIAARMEELCEEVRHVTAEREQIAQREKQALVQLKEIRKERDELAAELERKATQYADALDEQRVARDALAEERDVAVRGQGEAERRVSQLESQVREAKDALKKAEKRLEALEEESREGQKAHERAKEDMLVQREEAERQRVDTERALQSIAEREKECHARERAIDQREQTVRVRLETTGAEEERVTALKAEVEAEEERVKALMEDMKRKQAENEVRASTTLEALKERELKCEERERELHGRERKLSEEAAVNEERRTEASLALQQERERLEHEKQEFAIAKQSAEKEIETLRAEATQRAVSSDTPESPGEHEEAESKGASTPDSEQLEQKKVEQLRVLELGLMEQAKKLDGKISDFAAEKEAHQSKLREVERRERDIEARHDELKRKQDLILEAQKVLEEERDNLKTEVVYLRKQLDDTSAKAQKRLRRLTRDFESEREELRTRLRALLKDDEEMPPKSPLSDPPSSFEDEDDDAPLSFTFAVPRVPAREEPSNHTHDGGESSPRTPLLATKGASSTLLNVGTATDGTEWTYGGPKEQRSVPAKLEKRGRSHTATEPMQSMRAKEAHALPQPLTLTPTASSNNGSDNGDAIDYDDDDDVDVTSWTGDQSPPLSARDAESLVKRRRVAEELYQTEKSYIDSLESICSSVVRPLTVAARSDKPILTLDEVRNIFSSIEIIKSYNEVFLDKLEKRVTSWNDESSCVGDLFVEMCQWFKTYITYINNYTLAISTLAECQSRDSFGKFLSNIRVRQALKRQDLTSFLIAPIQRIPRYVLLLKDLLKHTPEMHADHENLRIALEKTMAITQTVNDAKEKHDNMGEMFEVATQFAGRVECAIVAPDRRFYKKGPLFRSPKDISDSPSKGTNYFILFSDVLIHARLKYGALDKPDEKQRLEFRRSIPIREILKIEDIKDTENGFRLICAHKVFKLYARTRSEKVEWSTAIGMVREEVESKPGTIHSDKSSRRRSLYLAW